MDIQKYINEHRTENETIVLNKFKYLSEPTHLVTFLSTYVDFNRVFASGVLSLSSKINTSDLFKENMTSVISANILYAAIDEYYNEQLEIKTHCNLSNELFNSILHFYKVFNKKRNSERNSFKLHSDVLSNYLYEIPFPSDKEIFRSLGFHLASENMGDIEFNSLDYIIKSNFKDLYFYLNSNNTYTWINIHTYAEKNHCNYAIDAINQALESYRGSLHRQELNSFIIEGYKNFLSLQNHFFEKAIK